MNRRIGIGLAALAACNGGGGSDGDATSVTVGIESADGTSATSQGDDAPDDGDDGDDGSNGVDGPDDGPDGTSGPPTKWDVGGEASMFCADKAAGLYCSGTTSVLCDDNGNVEDSTICDPEPCLEGSGCVTCLAGEFACHGPRVMACNAAGDPFFEEIELCDPAAAEACDVGLGTCVGLTPIGGTEPTGVYYQYAFYNTSVDGAFNSVCDLDSYGNRIYFVANAPGGLTVGYYDVDLLDTDGDGMLEPNQHPDNPDAMGPIEERVFTFVGSFPVLNNPGAFPNVMELFATPTKIYWTGPTTGITEYDLATATTVQVALPASFYGTSGYSSLSFLGHDDIHDVWYSGNEANRRVTLYDAASQQWGWAFEYPTLAGDHMDGIEVVTDPNTNIPYVYVSDMTSNFIGQYRLDQNMGWVQENLFTYNEATGALVEGFGFGALGHFWVGSYATSLYELGGGDLADFTGPEG